MALLNFPLHRTRPGRARLREALQDEDGQRAANLRLVELSEALNKELLESHATNKKLCAWLLRFIEITDKQNRFCNFHVVTAVAPLLKGDKDMEREEHMARTQAALGRPWPQVHDFLDQFFDAAPGFAHRIILHHRLGIELVVREFGEEARAVAEQHIRDDCDIIPAVPQEAYGLIQLMTRPEQLAPVNAILADLGLPLVSPPL